MRRVEASAQHIAKQRIKRRVESGERGAERCAIPGCGRPTMKAAKEGLAPHHCRSHVEHRARHGSYWLNTYTAAELKPYLTAASSYVRLWAPTDKFIAAAVTAMQSALDEAGPVEIATRLKGMSAGKRAKIGVARLRVAKVKPERLVAIVLAINAIAEEKGHRAKEFRMVQACKAAHRLASGTGWVSYDAQGREHRSRTRAYPRSSGRVLRLMGRMLEEPCDWVIEKHLKGVLTHKQRYGRGPRKAPS
ncbi:hypothetical protein CQ12_39960 [Bradyrhizobium jicamae]|uniref:Uncharacterized protein n=2 Tax=Bradyrhizobium jicamae TaxID=280332 RepID=A0A0R3LNB8_9BRAD|nr:hypothetical protein CQ12_39960 [Bradyrhizobium jicamae]